MASGHSVGTVHPNRGLLVAASWLCASAWVSFGLLIVLIVVGSITKAADLYPPALIVGFIFLCTSAAFVLMAIGLRCPACNNRVFSNRRGTSGDGSHSAIQDWAVVVGKILTKGQFQCAHCERPWTVK